MQNSNILIKCTAKDTAYVSMILDKLQRRIGDFQMNLGVYPRETLKLVILPNKVTYKKITQNKGRVVEHSEAFYSSVDHTVFIKSPDQLSYTAYDKIIMHEYVHWFLDRTMKNVPLWFNEGMAIIYSGDFGFTSYYDLLHYQFLGYHLSLSQMVDNYPENSAYFNMFYLTSAFAVNYLRSKYIKEWSEFWNKVGANVSGNDQYKIEYIDFISNFNASFLMSLHTFNKEFDKILRQISWQFLFFGINFIIISLLPFIVIIGWYRYKNRLHRMSEFSDSTDAIYTNDFEENSDIETEKRGQTQ